MADRTPVKILPDDGSDSTGLGEFIAADTIGIVDGGTGLATIAANNILTGNGTSALTSESNLTFSGSALAVTGTLSTSGAATLSSLVCTAGATFGGAYSGGSGVTISTAGVLQANGAVTFDSTLAAGATTVTSLNVSDGNITNVGDIAVDTVSGDDDSNTTIGFPGSDVLTLSTGGTTAMHIDLRQNVGFGRTPEGTNSTDTHIAFGGTGLLSTITAQDVGEPVYFSSNGYNSGGWKYIINDEAHLFGLQSGQFQFYNAPSGVAADSAITWTQRMNIAAGGDVTVNTGNLVIGTSGKGIDFSANTSDNAGMTSELLDDYEEGLTAGSFSATSGSITMNSIYDTLAYTKVGRMVTVTGFLYASSVSSPSGTLYINGLPFVLADLTDKAGQTPVNMYMNGLSTGISANVIGELQEGESRIACFFGDGATQASDLADAFQAGTDCRISITYFTA